MRRSGRGRFGGFVGVARRRGGVDPLVARAADGVLRPRPLRLLGPALPPARRSRRPALRQPAHFHQGIGLDDREIIVRQEAFADQLFGQRFVDPFDRAEAADGPLDLLVELFAGHDFDVPAAELAGQADVLPAAADGQRQLIFAHQHDRPAEHLSRG